MTARTGDGTVIEKGLEGNILYYWMIVLTLDIRAMLTLDVRVRGVASISYS